MNDEDGTKLVIGTKTFNALVTSSLRIDPNVHSHSTPSIGSITCSFMLISLEYSKATKIYLDDTSVKKALALSSRKECVNYIEPSGLLFQIRQVRSKFHRKSTYYLCRVASCIKTNHDHRPYTIFTLCDYNSGDYSDGKIGSKLVRKIALEVLTKEQPKLKKDLTKKFQQNCSKEGRVKGFFDEIIKLFKKQQQLEILGNKDLDQVLTQLASHLSSYIAIANKSIEVTVSHKFNEK